MHMMTDYRWGLRRDAPDLGNENSFLLDDWISVDTNFHVYLIKLSFLLYPNSDDSVPPAL